jgi:hypothetical protein
LLELFFVILATIVLWKTKGSVVVKIIMTLLILGVFSQISGLHSKKTLLETNPSEYLENVLDESKKLAKEKYPNDSEEDALLKLYKKRLKSKHAKTPEYARGSFLSFYVLNSEVFVEYCNELGVDITSFKVAFENSHKEIYVYALSQLPENESIDEMLKKFKPFLRQSIISQVDTIAKQGNISTKEVCKRTSGNAVEVAKESHFSKSFPELYAVLKIEMNR